MSLSKNFQYSSEIVRLLAEISSIQGEINGQTISFEKAQEITTLSQSESAHYSTRIEGNKLTLKQVTTALESQKKTKSSRDLKEVVNYAKTRRFIFQSSVKLSEKNILSSHSMLLKGIVLASMIGRYRKQQNAIRDSQTSGLVYLPPEWTDVPEQMSSLIQICTLPNNKSEAMIISGIFHFHFESIHPFMDGNGRLGRLWANNILKSSNMNFVEYAALEKFHEMNRGEYYSRLHSLQGDLFYNISPNLDLTSWLEYWLAGLHFTAQEALERLSKRRTTQDEIFLDSRIRYAMSLFKKHKKLSADQYQTITGMGRTQSIADFNKLIRMKFIKKVGGGRSTVYILIE